MPGFKVSANDRDKHEVCKLEIHEDEARVVRMMYDLCIGSGYGRFKQGAAGPYWIIPRQRGFPSPLDTLVFL